MKQLSVLILTIFLVPHFLFAQNLTDGTDRYENGTNANNRYDDMNNAGQAADGSLDLGADTQVRDVNGFNNTDSGGRSNGSQSIKDSNSTQMLGMIMGAMFMAMCGPKNPAACAMAAMSFADAAASGNNAGNSTDFRNNLLPNGESLTGNEGADSKAQEQLANLKQQGFIVNEDGSVTTPEGENLAAGDFGSVASLQEKGLSAQQAQSALDMFKKVSENAQKEVAAKKSGGGNYGIADSDDGGGGTTIIDEGSESSVGNASKRKGSIKGKKGNRLPASELAGLKKNFNGDPIGISLANIFLIVKKKYKDKDDEKSFIKKEY